MKALKHHARRPAATPLLADDVLEFHAGRLVLLLATCGSRSGAINGLTKMAKLDFFVRYPDFFDAVRRGANQSFRQRGQAIEAAMVRHRYGPWDKRYYHVIAFLEARGLIAVKKSGRSVRIALTRRGKAAAEQLAGAPAFVGLRGQMQRVAESLASRTGNELKTLIYGTFDEEIGRRPLGHVIAGEQQ